MKEITLAILRSLQFGPNDTVMMPIFDNINVTVLTISGSQMFFFGWMTTR